MDGELGRLHSRRMADVRDTFASDEDVPLLLVAVGILQAHKLLAQRTETALAHLDLTLPRYEVLGILDNADGGQMTLRDLKRASLLHPATMTYTTNGLFARGLITRAASLEGSDRRMVIAKITPEGRRIVKKAMEALREVRFGVGDLLTSAQARQLAPLLSRIR